MHSSLANRIAIRSVIVPLLLAGCSGSMGPTKHRVSGTVSLGGKPMPDGEVYFRLPATGAIEVFSVKAGAFGGAAAAGPGEGPAPAREVTWCKRCSRVEASPALPAQPEDPNRRGLSEAANTALQVILEEELGPLALPELPG